MTEKQFKNMQFSDLLDTYLNVREEMKYAYNISISNGENVAFIAIIRYNKDRIK